MLTGVAALLAFGGLLLASRPHPPALAAVRAAAIVRPASAAVAATTHPTPPARPAASVAPARAASSGAPTTGTIITSTRSHDHRIYVDGHVAGETGRAIEVCCGRHEARYGSRGRSQTIDVPCGGQYTLSPRW
jgi:serine/threonine-protein kinase